MGRRSRKRGVIGPVAPPAPGTAAEETPRPEPPRPARRPERRAHLDEAPQPPGAPVPLTEITIFAGLVLLGVALLGGGGSRGVLLAFGLALVTIATLELSLREHLAGYRSHSALIAGVAAILTGVVLVLTVNPAKAVVLVAAGLVFALVLQVMRRIFAARSGGMSWRA